MHYIDTGFQLNLVTALPFFPICIRSGSQFATLFDQKICGLIDLFKGVRLLTRNVAYVAFQTSVICMNPRSQIRSFVSNRLHISKLQTLLYVSKDLDSLFVSHNALWLVCPHDLSICLHKRQSISCICQS